MSSLPPFIAVASVPMPPGVATKDSLAIRMHIGCAAGSCLPGLTYDAAFLCNWYGLVFYMLQYCC